MDELQTKALTEAVERISATDRLLMYWTLHEDVRTAIEKTPLLKDRIEERLNALREELHKAEAWIKAVIESEVE